jgi:hypothetical protein
MGTLRRVTDAQVKELRLWLQLGASLKKAAMKAGMDRKSGRKYRGSSPLPSERRGPRHWRTRPDPLAAVWPEIEEQLMREPGLQATTLLGWLQAVYPGVCPDGVRRTLERRVRIWKATHGPAKEVFFAQVHEPGRLGASDFTHMEGLNVTIAGQRFDHLVYHFVLTRSNWEHVTVCFSESFASLSEGLQNAWWALGGVPARHRTDRMTLAVHADGHAEQFTTRYQALMRHYGVTAEATNAYSGHENGDCEQSHRRFKDAVAQALMLRNSREFASRADYEAFLSALVQRRNTGRSAAFTNECPALGGLPTRRLETEERKWVRVHRGCTVRVQNNLYSVPARLIGEMVEVRIGVEEIEVWYADTLIQRMPRLRGRHNHRIDYHHVISWLVRKPGAFARYAYQADMYPTTTFRRAYDRMRAANPTAADRDYVQLLHLAAETGETAVEAALVQLLDGTAPIGVRAVRALLGRETPAGVAEFVQVPVVDLQQYDALLTTVNNVEEITNDTETNRGPDALPDGTAPADNADAIRGGGAAGGGGVVELPRLSAGTDATGMLPTTGETCGTDAQSIEAASGKELGHAGPQALADQGRAAVAWSSERRLPGSPGECSGVRPPGFGQDPRPGSDQPGVGEVGTTRIVHDLRPVGAGPAGGEARLHAEGDAETAEPLGGAALGRPGLRAAEPGGDGGLVHALGGAVRTRQRALDEQSGVLAMDPDIQRPDDDGGGGGSLGTSQRDRRVERAELPSRGRQTIETTRRIGSNVRAPAVRSGSAPVAFATLRLPTLRRTAPPAWATARKLGKGN